MDKEKEIKRVATYIDNQKLNSKKSSEKKILVRYYLYAYLKIVVKMSNASIGGMFNKTRSAVSIGIKKHNELLDGDNRIYYLSTVSGASMAFPIEGGGVVQLNSPRKGERMIEVKGVNLSKLKIIKDSLPHGTTYEDAVAHLINSVIILG